MRSHVFTKLIAFLLVLGLLVGVVGTAYAASGKIVVQARLDGKYIAHASVYLDGNYAGSIPSKEKALLIKNVPSGYHVVKVRYTASPTRFCSGQKGVRVESGDTSYCDITLKG
jgi:hypothetical protein